MSNSLKGIPSGSAVKKLAVVISHPIQHFAPLFAELAKQGSIELKVFYCCDWGVNEYMDPGFGHAFKWDIPLLSGYEFEFLPIKKRPQDLGFFSIDNPQVAKQLESFDPDAVWIHGYSHRSSWRAYLWAVRNTRKILYFGDSELLARRNWRSKFLKRLVLPTFFSRCHAFLTIGDNNEAYYRHYGVTKSKMYRGSFPVDIERFQQALSMTEEERSRGREQQGLHAHAIVGLFIGKFISIKRPLDIVRAVQRIRDKLPGLQVLMLGSGPLEGEIKQNVDKFGLQDRVLLPGFINQNQIPDVLRLGDFLIMSSEVDPHPLAVTEAMSVGNAVIATNRVGCVGPTDAAREGENTLVYPSGDVDALCDCITGLVTDQDMLTAYRARSVELAETQDVSVMVRAVTNAMAD